MYTLILPGTETAHANDEESAVISQKIVDRLRHELGDGYRDVINNYRTRLAESIEQLRDMLKSKRYEEVIKACAMIESGSTQMGANRLARVLSAIRQYMRSGEWRRNPERLEWLVYELDYEYARLKEYLASGEMMSGLPRRPANIQFEEIPILVAIPDETTRMLVREVLHPEGYVIYEATTVEDAMFVINEQDPVAVLIDDLSGMENDLRKNISFDIAREVRAASKHTPILVMTNYSDESMVAAAVSNGASDFISRPIYMPILKQRLRFMCGTEISRRKILHMAMHDMLTGLPNRHFFNEQMRDAISLHKRIKLKFAVMYIDLDGFKEVNDLYGHEVGDQLLIDVANRMKSMLREEDVLSRFGGDEFVAIIPGLSAESAESEATIPPLMILEALSRPFDINGMPVEVTCSIGLTIYPDHGEEQDELVNGADSMMYDVKAGGKNSYMMKIG